MRIKEIGELGFIEWVRKKFKAPGKEVIVGIGDDTAVIKDKEGYLLVTKDLLIEDVHFKISFDPFLLGRKSMAVNISDIASMGGEPVYSFLGIGFPKELSWQWIEKFMLGIRKICEEHGVFLLGGDTCSSSKLFVSITLIGRTDKVVLRSSASEEEYIYITGKLGDSGAGLYILLNNLKSEDSHYKYLIERHLNPTPRVKEGRFLKNIASSMIDLSDGLSADLHNLCRESKVGALIYADRIPISEELKKFCAEIDEDPFRFALHGGEDYELLFTSPMELESKIVESISATLIGRIERKEKGIRIFKNGKEECLSRSGWEHF